MRAPHFVLRVGTIILFSAVGILLLGLLSYTFILQPQIMITAPTGSIVHLTDIQTSAQLVQTTVNGSSATLHAGVGNYMVTIDDGTSSQVFYVKTAWLKRMSLQFTAPKQLTATLLAQQVAYNAIGSESSFAYLNTSSQTVEQVGSTAKTVLDSFGSAAPRNATTSAQAMNVIAGNRAIVLTHGQLYVLQHGQLEALDTNGFPDSIASLVIGTNPAQESFAVLANKTLYWYRTPSAQPQQVSILTKQADQLAVGGDEIIAYSTQLPNARENIRYAYTPTYVVDPLLISATSGGQQTIASGPIVDASISPDGQYATLEQRGAAHTNIVRLADDTIRQSVENADTLTPRWVSNTRYIFGKGSSIWAFDVEALSASKVASLPNGLPVTSVTYNKDLEQYLVTTYPSEQGAAIYQIR